MTTLILLGRYLEARAKRRSSAGDPAAAGARREGGPRRARRRGGARPRGGLLVGDVFVVPPGEKIATDGVVVEGESAVDQSQLTGEASRRGRRRPRGRGRDVNSYGRLVIRATRVGADTALAQIARLVEAAQTGKAPVQRLADRISAVFVPVVIALSLVTLAGWLAAAPRPRRRSPLPSPC